MKREEAHSNLIELVRAMGPGFHPDTPGEHYLALPDGVGPADVDRIVDEAIDLGLDVYAIALDVIHELDKERS